MPVNSVILSAAKTVLFARHISKVTATSSSNCKLQLLNKLTRHHEKLRKVNRVNLTNVNTRIYGAMVC